MNKGKEITYRKSIGLQCKEQLRAKFRTQDEAAKLAGITPQQAGNIVNGKTDYTIGTLTRFVEANGLNLSISTNVFETYKLMYE